MQITSFDEFATLARRGTFVPVVREVSADLLTPVSAFLRIAEHSEHAFLFESVEGGERLARYSFLGKDPFLILRAHRDGTAVIEEGGTRRTAERGPMQTLRELMDAYRAPFVPGLPRFTGGAVGMLDYEAVRWFEPSVPVAGGGEGGEAEDAAFMLFDTVLAFDHVQHRILIISNARVRGGADLRSLYDGAVAKIGFLERELERPLAVPRRPAGTPPEFRSNVEATAFEDGVRRIREHIAEGDVYQTVLSQRFEAAIEAPPFEVYRALRRVNPSPYMFFIRSGGRSVVGASPEMLVRVEGDRIETHPIAGTRPRGASEEEDRRLAEELKRSEKERAEHVMLVDLGRNDVGRVAAPGSVRVPTYMSLERYSHVMHLVSVVEGRLAEDRDRLDALASCFPAGTVSGAPKVRAMQLIAELEPEPRGLYAGSVGYLDFAGNLDFCIAIRTIVIEHGRARVQAGAGVVADSDPAAERRETRDKAGAMIRALEIAEAGD
ncbi:MAG: anthranilate synthase component I [Planctomycetota bacterium]|jgi:anthranilate synthase component 1